MPLPIHTGFSLPDGDIADLGPVQSPWAPPAAAASSSAPPATQIPAAAGQAPAQAPRTFLGSDRVSPASITRLNIIATSGSAEEKFLASTLLSQINDGTLKLGHPACQTGTRAVYGNRVVIPGNNVMIRSSREGIMAARFKISEDGRLELVEARLRERFSRSECAKITCWAPSGRPTLPTSEAEVPLVSDTHRRSDVEFIREQVDLTRCATVERGDVVSAAGLRRRQATVSSISGEEFDRNRRVAATLHARGWTNNEVAEFKNTPAHIAILRATHSNEPALLDELRKHINTRRALGNIVGNHLFFSTSSGTNVTCKQRIPDDRLFSPTHQNISDWWTSHLSSKQRFFYPAGNADIDINTARGKIRETPRQEAWEKACAPVANKLLNEEKLTDDQLKALTWGALEDKFQGESQPTLKAFRRRALNTHQQIGSNALVFPKVPEGMTLTEHLRMICATYHPATRAEV